jgi:hypothetical protein
MANAVRTDQPKSTSKEISEAMHPLYTKMPMVYDLGDNEQNFLLPQPYKRPNRAGMLTHPAWLIAFSLNDHTDPIRRGKWIRERLLAGLVPNVPITVDATIPVDHHKTLRERLTVTEKQECWRCHEQMNPLGHPFEIYDDFVRYRTEEFLDKLPKASECRWRPNRNRRNRIGRRGEGRLGIDQKAGRFRQGETVHDSARISLLHGSQ